MFFWRDRAMHFWSWYRSLRTSNAHACLSISSQICCEIKLVYFWIHLDARPNFVIVYNLSCPSLFQYTNKNHASGRILVSRSFSKAWFHWDSQVVMELYSIITYLKWVNMTLCLSHSIMFCFISNFRDKILHESPMVF